jgi:hypothetical protein
VDASAKLGYGAGLTLGIGILELACLAVYLFPRTAPLGALLLTGYLGGAVATHLRAGSPLFSVVFPLLLGALLWGGLALRERRVRALLSLISYCAHPPQPWRRMRDFLHQQGNSPIAGAIDDRIRALKGENKGSVT